MATTDSTRVRAHCTVCFSEAVEERVGPYGETPCKPHLTSDLARRFGELETAVETLRRVVVPVAAPRCGDGLPAWAILSVVGDVVWDAEPDGDPENSELTSSIAHQILDPKGTATQSGDASDRFLQSRDMARQGADEIFDTLIRLRRMVDAAIQEVRAGESGREANA